MAQLQGVKDVVLKGESDVTSNAWCSVPPCYLAVVYFTMLPVLAEFPKPLHWFKSYKEPQPYRCDISLSCF